jgi:hypothetical protein
MLWKDFLTGWGTQEQNAFLFLQWCLHILSNNSDEPVDKWCDWSKISVRNTSSTDPKGNPVYFQIGKWVLIDLFGVRLDLHHLQDRLQRDNHNNDNLMDTFTKTIHASCLRHHLQTFFRQMVKYWKARKCVDKDDKDDDKLKKDGSGQPETKPKPMDVIMKMIHKSGWCHWRCSSCAAWTELVREEIVGPSIEEDLYNIRGASTKKFTLEEWIRIFTLNGKVTAREAGKMVGRGGMERQMWVQSALVFQREFLQICEHTTSVELRQKFLNFLLGEVEQRSSEKDFLEHTGTKKELGEWIVRKAPVMVADIKQWLVTNFKFIPFSQIDFTRMIQSILIFRYGWEELKPSTNIEEEEMTGQGENPWSMFAVTTVLLEEYDRAKCRSVLQEERERDTRWEWILERHPMRRDLRQDIC